MTTTVLNTKICEFENKISNKSKYITTPEFNKLTAENFAARLEKPNLVSKTDFVKLTSFNKRITFQVQKKVNNQIKKDYNFFLGRIYFTNNTKKSNAIKSSNSKLIYCFLT